MLLSTLFVLVYVVTVHSYTLSSHNHRMLTTLPISKINIQNSLQVEYYVTVQIGTPPQEFNLLIDTGSSALWIDSTKCVTCGAHKLYDSSKSSTFSNAGSRSVMLSYGSGLVSGVTSSDIIKIGSFTASRADFIQATSVSSFQAYTVSDGLFGCAYPALLAYASPSLLNVATPLLQKLNVTQYALLLSSATLYLGGIDTSKIIGNMVSIPLTLKTYWQIRIDDFTIGSLKSFGSHSAILDSGTSFLLLDPSTFNAWLASMKGITTYSTYPLIYKYDDCNAQRLPTMYLKINGNIFNLTGSDYTLRVYGKCILAVQSTSGNGNFDMVLGQVFMRKFATLFDFQNGRVSFGLDGAYVPSILPPPPPPPPSANSPPTPSEFRPFTETTIIAITCGGVVALFLFIFIVRACDPTRLRETTRMIIAFYDVVNNKDLSNLHYVSQDTGAAAQVNGTSSTLQLTQPYPLRQ